MSMQPTEIIPRLVKDRLREALSDSPVVLVHGPRQCGKTTLVRQLEESMAYGYFSLDDDVVRLAAEGDPLGFVADLPRRVILDEVQRVPSLFTALKMAVDKDREPGRFLLTGSTSPLFVPRLADSLAGRMEIIRLFPFAQCEIEAGPTGFFGALFGTGFRTRHCERLGVELAERIVAGGYPAALARTTPRRRAVWYRDYVETMVQRDVRDLARIASLDTLPRLLQLAAGQTAHLLNVTDLAGPFQVSRPTIRSYLTLLEQAFLLDELSPWHNNRLSRLVKTPKIHIGDTGIAATLLGMDVKALRDDRPLLGQLVETFVYQELQRQASGRDEEVRFYHFRDRDGLEVDIVMEKEGRLVAGVEVKAGATVSGSDFRGLRKLAAAAGHRFASGVVLFDGETCASFGDRLYAAPISTLWQTR